MARASHRASIQFPNAHSDGIWSTFWTANDKILTGSVDEVAKAWTVTKDTITVAQQYPGHVLGTIAIVGNKEGTHAVTSSLDCQIRVLNLSSGVVEKTIDAGPGELWQIAYSPDESRLASGSQQGKINLFDLEAEKLVQEISTQAKFVLSVAYSPDGKHVACGSFDGFVGVYDVETGSLVHKYEGGKLYRTKPVRSVSYSPDGKLFAASDDMHVNVYDTAHDNAVATLSGHISWVLSVDCSPDGRQFATGGADRRVKIWDIGMRRCLSTFDSHTDQVWSVAYNSTGSRLVSGGDDALLQIYETAPSLKFSVDVSITRKSALKHEPTCHALITTLALQPTSPRRTDDERPVMFIVRLLLMVVSVPVSIALWACLAFVCGFFTSTKKKKSATSSTATDDDKKPLRVGFVHPDFGIGGAENLVVNAMLALQKKNVQVTMFTAHHDVSHCFEETRGNGPLAKCVKVYGDWLPKTIFGKLYAFCAWMRVLYVTLVIGFLYSNELDAFFVDQVSISIPLLRYFGKPVLFYGHYPDKLLSIKSGSLLKRLYRWPLDFLEEITTAASDLVVVNSKFTRSVFEQTFPRVKKQELGILYPPVDVSVFETFTASAPRNPTLFVSLNRFERKKNVALAIHALAKLQRLISADEFVNVKLIIAGGYDPNNTENIDHLKELEVEVAKYALKDHVEFRTSVSDHMKKELLVTAQAVLYTPSNEHFGIVPVEAMTCGTPVIAVNSGGPLESILEGETGFLCESSDDAFAAAMAKVCGAKSSERVAEMGDKGKQRAKELFSLETFADSLFALVESLV